MRTREQQKHLHSFLDTSCSRFTLKSNDVVPNPRKILALGEAQPPIALMINYILLVSRQGVSRFLGRYD